MGGARVARRNERSPANDFEQPDGARDREVGRALEHPPRAKGLFVMRSLLVISSFVALGLVVGCSADPLGAPTPTPDGGAGGGISGGGDVDGGDAGSPLDAGTDVAVPPGCDATKLPSQDACVITEASGVFVSPTGSAVGDGSRANPFGSLGAAIAAAKTAKKRVYACVGSFAESVSVANGVSMFGGFDCSTWAWSAAGRTTIAAPTSPAVRADGIAQPTRIEGFDVVAPPGSANAPSSIGMIATGSPGVLFIHGSITASAGAAGAAGVDGVQLANGPAADGSDNIGDQICTTVLCKTRHSFTAGGLNQCVGKGITGGAGGDGGNGGAYANNLTSIQPTRGLAAVATLATNVGATVFDGINAWSAAQPGVVGASGQDGSNASAVGVFTATGYAPPSPTAGSDGLPGQGGGGGSGQLGIATNGYYGAPGASGGAGGCPGLAGGPGASGGASVAILAIDSGFRVESSKLVSGAGGAGGASGLSSVPTAGGIGGKDVSTHAVKSGNAANGGWGGLAGLSGSGSGGPSIVIARHGSAPQLVGTTTTVGAGGAGVSIRTINGRVYPASAAGTSAATFDF
jgi:hypothetical protein